MCGRALAEPKLDAGSDSVVTLSDGSTLDIAGLSPDRLVELQWREERASARQILAAQKGSHVRAAAVRRAYETITRIYATAWCADGETPTMGFHARQGRLVLHLLRRQQRRGLAARLFEIGYSHGVLLKLVSDAGFPVAGIEVSPSLRRQAARLLGPAHEPCLHVGSFLEFDLPAAQRPASLVYWNDVFEHVPPDEIVDYLKRIIELLAPGGQLVTVTPNWHQRPSDITKAFSPSRTEAAGLHLREYTLREVTRLLRAAGFRSVATPLLVTPRNILLLGRGLAGLKRLAEPALEALPFRLAKLLCRGFGLSTTIATKAG